MHICAKKSIDLSPSAWYNEAHNGAPFLISRSVSETCVHPPPHSNSRLQAAGLVKQPVASIVYEIHALHKVLHQGAIILRNTFLKSIRPPMPTKLRRTGGLLVFIWLFHPAAQEFSGTARLRGADRIAPAPFSDAYSTRGYARQTSRNPPPAPGSTAAR